MASVVQLQTLFNINDSISIYYNSLIFWKNPQLDSGDLGTQGKLQSHVDLSKELPTRMQPAPGSFVSRSSCTWAVDPSRGEASSRLPVVQDIHETSSTSR